MHPVKHALQSKANKEKAALLGRFFKTGRGEYGEGDVFLGVVVPEQRKVAKEFAGIGLGEVEELLTSHIHEHRLTALIILVLKFKSKKTSDAERKEILDFYLAHTKYINNWDLVDLSAPNIVGESVRNGYGGAEKAILYKLAGSEHLWEKRISILGTFTLIKYGQFTESLRIAEKLLLDKHDLIHKAVGWMLREIGKRNPGVERAFLQKHYKSIPRTMLRYAIEKFPDQERKGWLNGKK